MLSLGDHSAEALASVLDDKWDDIKVTVETVNAGNYLVFEYDNQGKKGDITIFTNSTLGFPQAQNRHNEYLHSYLGASVRAFFSQGGRKCYVIRMGDPLPLFSEETQRVQQLARLLTGSNDLWSSSTLIKHLVNAYIPQITLSHERPENWHGVDHLLGLSDISYLSLPDLPELLAETPLPASHATLPAIDEVFVVCTPGLATARLDHGVTAQAPRCNENGYQVWSRIIERLIKFLHSMNREVHLISSLPLPGNDIKQRLQTLRVNTMV